MTQSRKFRPFLPTVSVAAAILAGVVPAQAQDTEYPRRVPLCELQREWPLPAAVLRRIRAGEDYEDLLRYSSENCPEVGLLLTEGTATAAIAGTTPATGSGDDLRRVPLCRLDEEWPLSPGVLRRIRAGADFEDLLRYSSKNGPEVALLLADAATATLPGEEDDDTGVDREGPEDRNPPNFPETENPPVEEPPVSEPPVEPPVEEPPVSEPPVEPPVEEPPVSEPPVEPPAPPTRPVRVPQG